VRFCALDTSAVLGDRPFERMFAADAHGSLWPVASLRGNATRLSLSERSGHEPVGQIGHIGRE
jgi:hypothetical protein